MCIRDSLGDIHRPLTGCSAFCVLSQQRRVQIECTFHSIPTQQFGQPAVLHNAIIVAEGARLAFASGEHQRIEPFTHIDPPLIDAFSLRNSICTVGMSVYFFDPFPAAQTGHTPYSLDDLIGIQE